MAFNISALKGDGVGEGLLSELSKVTGNTEGMKIEFVRLDQARPSGKNKYHITDEKIQELKQSIRICGLLQPLECKRVADDDFVILGGETRYHALRELNEEGAWGDSFPAIIKDPNDIDLPLAEESKEMFAIMEPNAQSRKYTDMDKLNEIDEYEKIFTELKNNGCFEYEGQQIKGRRNRELIAEKMGIKERNVAKGIKINKVAVPELKEAIEEGKININIAEKVASLPEEEQRELIQDTSAKEKIEASDVQTYKKKKRQQTEEEVERDGANYVVTIEDLNLDIERIKSGLKKSNGAKLTRKQYENYKNLISRLDKILTI